MRAEVGVTGWYRCLRPLGAVEHYWLGGKLLAVSLCGRVARVAALVEAGQARRCQHCKRQAGETNDRRD